MYPFKWQELLIYVLPIIIAFLMRRLIRPHLRLLYPVRLNEAMLLLPIVIITSDLLARLLFGISIFPIWVFVSSVLLGVHLYDYVRSVPEFLYLPYFFESLSMLFKWSFFLMLGMMIARILSYF